MSTVMVPRTPTGPIRYLVTLLAILAGLSISACAGERTSDAQPGADQEMVVLLHGLGRSEAAMWLLATRIESAGLEVVRISYESLREPPEEILAAVSQKIDACCRESPEPVHFVGHSLGGLIIRGYLADNAMRTPGRVVLIATPNAGTPLADAYQDSWLMDLAGPTARRLGTSPDSFPNSLPSPDYPVGVIAGAREALFLDLIPGEDDGLVPVESTKLPDMVDFIIVGSNHSMMRYTEEVARLTIAFLSTGEFLDPRRGCMRSARASTRSARCPVADDVLSSPREPDHRMHE